MSRFVRIPLLIMLAALAVIVTAGATNPAAAAGRSAASAFPRLQSRYIRMPDGVRLAVDIWLPAGTTDGSRLPTVLEADRYWRARAYTGGIKNNQNYYIATPWNARGYAYVFADLRGTGASFGTLKAELGRQLVADVGSLANWIAAQPWSNGRVGVTGVSYSADIAMGSLALHNPHITAAAPLSYDFDPYEDIMRPGGILIQPLVAPYGLLLQILDKADGITCATSAQTRQLCQAAGYTGHLPEPAGGPDGPALRAAARAQHFHNANLPAMAQAGVYRDWAHGPQSWTVASVGPKTAAIAAGGVPILTFAGWLDAGTANGVLSVRQPAQHPGVLDRAVEPRPGVARRPVPAQPPADPRRAPATQRPALRVLRPLRQRRRPPRRHPADPLLHAKRRHLAHHHPLAGRRHPGPPALLRRRAHADPAARRRPAGLGPAAPQPHRGHRPLQPVEHQPHR
jgi:uncharacterized protein